MFQNKMVKNSREKNSKNKKARQYKFSRDFILNALVKRFYI